MLRVSKILTAMVVFHGTPHQFEEFSLDHLGTGEGAQAYGWGLYFTGTEDVARYYRNSLSGKARVPEEKVHELLLEANGGKSIQNYQDAIGELFRQGTANSDKDPQTIARRSQYANIELRAIPLDALTRVVKYMQDNGNGKIYEATIPDGPYIMWDEPLTAQDPKIAQAMKELIGDVEVKPSTIERGKTDLFINGKWHGYAPEGFDNLTGERLYNLIGMVLGSQKEASLKLRSMGVTGIKYRDGISRGLNNGASYNFVLFNDKDIKMVKK